ncbi:hypothetical protein L218DRAFT_948127 [Marasmius fiardii PR-910]|nr:hypothetical protein L218DRAFT_948127 [Marasmius fiardii PR-910]
MNRKRRAALSVQRRIPVGIREMVFSTLCLSLHEYSLDIDYDFPYSRFLRVPAILITQPRFPKIFGWVTAFIRELQNAVTNPFFFFYTHMPARIRGGWSSPDGPSS